MHTQLRSVFLMDIDCKSNFNIYFLFKVTLSDSWFCLMAAWDVGGSCGARSNSQWKQKQTDDQTAAPVCLQQLSIACESLRLKKTKSTLHCVAKSLAHAGQPSACGRCLQRKVVFNFTRSSPPKNWAPRLFVYKRFDFNNATLPH